MPQPSRTCAFGASFKAILTIHYQPATWKRFDSPVDMFVRLDLHVQSQVIHVSVEIYCHVQIDQS